MPIFERLNNSSGAQVSRCNVRGRLVPTSTWDVDKDLLPTEWIPWRNSADILSDMCMCVGIACPNAFGIYIEASQWRKTLNFL
ncbi:hypothetical protein Csa_017023 [Cucumis sativus]|uniref:Uncharacterized protein n=1 Tax=Cucumis sativus TaxID=3659 RepID=A0A0A0KBZ3_CUCSA|nr:hypothetical protein Csa_017023 [Cucumis sativus]